LATTACEALRTGKRLALNYDGFPRVVEVHAVGRTQENNWVMRVWQVRGGSVHNEPVGWKLMRLDEASSGRMLDNEVSNAPRTGYKRGDMQMSGGIKSQL
jgi:hypothetical protein